MFNIEFHADDYALSLHNSKRILELLHEGRLDGISIIPNISNYDECMKLLKSEWDGLEKKPKLTVHINLIDGNGLSHGFSPYPSWEKLFLTSYLPGPSRDRASKALTEEIRAQIKRVYEDTKDLAGVGGELRLDSHTHTHMIPIVFDAMMKAVSDEDSYLADGSRLCDHLSYVRLSREPLFMFYGTSGIRGTFPFINVIKNILLRVLSFRADKILSNLGIEHGMLWGLITGGHMDAERLKLLYPGMKAYAERRNSYLEILWHPGRVLAEEDLPEFSPSDREAILSENRDIEFDSVRKIFETFR